VDGKRPYRGGLLDLENFEPTIAVLNLCLLFNYGLLFNSHHSATERIQATAAQQAYRSAVFRDFNLTDYRSRQDSSVSPSHGAVRGPEIT